MVLDATQSGMKDVDQRPLEYFFGPGQTKEVEDDVQGKRRHAISCESCNPNVTKCFVHPSKFNVTTSRNIQRVFIWITKRGKISSNLSISKRASFLIVSQMRLPKSAPRAGMDGLRPFHAKPTFQQRLIGVSPYHGHDDFQQKRTGSIRDIPFPPPTTRRRTEPCIVRIGPLSAPIPVPFSGVQRRPCKSFDGRVGSGLIRKMPSLRDEVMNAWTCSLSPAPTVPKGFHLLGPRYVTVVTGGDEARIPWLVCYSRLDWSVRVSFLAF